MIEAIGNLIRYIVILIFLAVILEMILPQGQFRRYLRMLVGVLLILTLLSPLQNIMRLAPGWNIPVFLTAPAGKEELELILQRGERMREENFVEALKNYRYHLFTVVNNLLEEEFAVELRGLELILEENPGSMQFGAIKNMTATVRAKESLSPLAAQGSVEEVNISISRGEATPAVVPEAIKDTAADAAAEKEVSIAQFLARYFFLPKEQVAVRIIP